MITISIIIATFNASKTIQIALDSVKEQTYQDWECIIVDGASTDNTVNIIQEYATNDSRIRYISEPDKGIYDAFNKGWKMANGEWIYYLGSDDKLTLNGFTDLMNQIDNSYSIVSGNTYIIKIDGTIKTNISQGFSGCHQGKLMKKDLFYKYNGFDESFKLLGDADLMTKLSNDNIPIKNYPIVIAYFTMGGMSQNLHGFKTRIEESLIIIKKDKRIKNPYTKWFISSIYKLGSIIYRMIRSKFFME